LRALLAHFWPAAPPADTFTAANRQFARSVLLGLVLVGAIGMLGPVLNYRADVAAIREQFQERIARESQMYAQALRLHFELLQNDLERLALRPEIDLFDGTTAPEQVLLDHTHHGSALFGVGVAVLDLDGQPVWTEPQGLLQQESSLKHRRWFRELVAAQSAVFDVLDPSSRTFVVAVPIIKQGALTGALVGLSNASAPLLPGGRTLGEHVDLVVLNAAGNLFLPESPPAWAGSREFPQLVDRLLATPGGAAVELGEREYFAAATPIGRTGLRLVLAADEHAAIAPTRTRLFYQLLFISLLPLSAIVLFSIFFQRVYRAFLSMEARAAEQQKMAVLGSAASLIAHEVKNALNGLGSAAALLSSDPGSALFVKTIRGQLDRLGHLATSLLYFGKPAAPQHIPARLDVLARETVEAVKVLPEAEEVSLTADLQEPIHVRCDPLLLVTAIDNLLRNAVEAAVTAKDLGTVSDPRVSIRAGQSDGHAFVAVEDNAGGPPPEVEQHLFEPFVTSKPRGIGLGLSMARRAVEQQGGSVAFERTATGSRFTVRLEAYAP
jgi:signal transduction histidine kinase